MVLPWLAFQLGPWISQPSRILRILRTVSPCRSPHLTSSFPLPRINRSQSAVRGTRGFIQTPLGNPSRHLDIFLASPFARLQVLSHAP